MHKPLLTLAILTMICTCALAQKKINTAIYSSGFNGENTYGEKGIFKALQSDDAINPYYIDQMNDKTLSDADVLIIPQEHWKKHNYLPENWREIVKKWVKEGHGLMAMHEVAGSRKHEWELFPDIAKGTGVNQCEYLAMAPGCPLTKTAAPNTRIELQIFKHIYNDHVVFRIGKNGKAAVWDISANNDSKQLETGNPVVVYGYEGQGRVVINGMLTGYHPDGIEIIPVDSEKKILLDAVKWLAGQIPPEEKNGKELKSGTYVGSLSGKWKKGPDGFVREATLPKREKNLQDLIFLKPIFDKIRPPFIKDKKMNEVPIGVLCDGKSNEWQKMLETWNWNCRIISEKDMIQGLKGISVLVIADAPFKKRYIPVLKEFQSKGGKLLVTEAGGYDKQEGSYNLTEIIHAGRYLSTISTLYMEHGMPSELKKPNKNLERQEYFIDKAQAPMLNGASGLSYFTFDYLRKPQRWRRWFPACKNSIESGMGTADYTRSLEFVTKMSPIWKTVSKPAHINGPWLIQLAFFLPWPGFREVDAKDIAEYCKKTGINVISFQVNYGNHYLKQDAPIGVMVKKILALLSSELKKCGVQLWINIFPSNPYARGYGKKDPGQCQIYDDGKKRDWPYCPIRGTKLNELQFEFLKKLFDENPYINGITLDEPRMGGRGCFCPECRKLFSQLYPSEKMDIDNTVFRKFREDSWTKLIEPYSIFMRKERPQNGVLLLVAPGINKAWGMNASKMSDAGVQLFANEFAYDEEDVNINDSMIKHSVLEFDYNRLSYIEKHPVIDGLSLDSYGKGIKVDVFYGGKCIAYVSDGEQSYPGIVLKNDTSSIYFCFDPLRCGGRALIEKTMQWFIDNSRNAIPDNMAWIPDGPFEFDMPSENEYCFALPDYMETRKIDTAAFLIDKSEVTNKDYEKFDPNHMRSEYASDDNMPVSNISWKEAVMYCNWRSRNEGLQPVYDEKEWWKADIERNGYRLPTLHEWQKAAKGPNNNKYSWGNIWQSKEARVNLDFTDGAARSGAFAPNYFGLHDITGNVWEWIHDGPSPKQKYICGGAWNSGEIEARISFFNCLHTNDEFQCKRLDVGFRCARNISNP